MKSLQKEQITQITYYEPQSAGINLQSPQRDSTPRSLTLHQVLSFQSFSNISSLKMSIFLYFLIISNFTVGSQKLYAWLLLTEFILAK